MRLMAGVTRCLLLCAVVLLLPAIVASQSCTYFYTSTSAPSPFPADLGVPWNVFNPTQLFLKASCSDSSVTANVGVNQNEYIYKSGYQWDGNKWNQISFTCTGQSSSSGDWCIGTAQAILPANTPFYLAYVCQVVNNAWKCGCRDQACTENLWQLQVIQPVSRTPEGKASNLVVLVHGCCTDENGVQEWDDLAGEITRKILGSNTSDKWEIVVWDWTRCTSDPNVECTPKRDYSNPRNPGLNWLIIDANTAYDNAEDQPGQPGQGSKLGDAIDMFSIYQYIHLIGHSAGAKLIDKAAKRLSELKNQKNAERPFIHLTFLDAYTRTGEDSGEVGGHGYGHLEGYDEHYAEHYVDKGPVNVADATLTSAFNFDITNWGDEKVSEWWEGGHIWPRRWYTRSVESPDRTGDFFGFSLSLEGGNEEFCTLAEQFPPGGECQLRDAASTALCGNIVTPTPCR